MAPAVPVTYAVEITTFGAQFFCRPAGVFSAGDMTGKVVETGIPLLVEDVEKCSFHQGPRRPGPVFHKLLPDHAP